MSALNIKSTDSFKRANKKTSAVALDNLTTPINNGIIRQNPLVGDQEMEKVLYGDIPPEYRLKQTKEEREL